MAASSRFSSWARSTTTRRRRLGCRRSLPARSASTIRAAPPPGAHYGSCGARSRYRPLTLGSSSNPRTRFVSSQNSRTRFNTRLTAMSARAKAMILPAVASSPFVKFIPGKFPCAAGSRWPLPTCSRGGMPGRDRGSQSSWPGSLPTTQRI